MTTLPAAYRHCLRVTRAAARNFYYSFLFLPGQRRRGMTALYAFCRMCDDIADGDGSVDDRQRALDDVRRGLDRATGGDPDGPVFTALADTIARFGVRTADLLAIVDGVEMDLTIARYERFDDLYLYCYRVASAVGLASIEIFGHAGESAREPAEALGIGMQLINILRDVAEDAALGRIYLPLEWLAAHGCTPETLLSGGEVGDLGGVLRQLAEKARSYHTAGQRLFGMLDRAARPCPATLAGLYLEILDRIERDGYRVVLSRRVGLPPAVKLSVALGSWVEHVLVGQPR